MYNVTIVQFLRFLTTNALQKHLEILEILVFDTQKLKLESDIFKINSSY